MPPFLFGYRIDTWKAWLKGVVSGFYFNYEDLTALKRDDIRLKT